MPRLFLHIGMHKTATTTLQETCARSRAWLREHGVVYPRLYLGVPFKPYSINHRLLTERWQSAEDSAAYRQSRAYWREHVAPQLAEAPDTDVLLSSEGLWNMPPGAESSRRVCEMLECFKGYDVRVIVYLRRQDRWLEAMHNQVVKNSAETRPLDQYVSESLRVGRADLFAKLSFWRESFGSDNVTVRVFEPERLEGGDIVRDFFSQLGVGDIAGLTRVDPQNAQLKPELMGLKMSLNRYLKKRGHRRLAKHAFSWLQRMVPGGSRRTMPYELAVEIMEHYAPGNERVAREMLQIEDGRLFLTLPGDEPRWEHYDVRPILER